MRDNSLSGHTPPIDDGVSIAARYDLSPGSHSGIQLLFTLYPMVQDRIRLYHKKVQKLENDQKLATSRRMTAIDIGAANRFITAAVTDLSAQQKAALQQVEHRGADDRSAKRRQAESDEVQRVAKKQAPAKQSATAFLDDL